MGDLKLRNNSAIKEARVRIESARIVTGSFFDGLVEEISRRYFLNSSSLRTQMHRLVSKLSESGDIVCMMTVPINKRSRESAFKGIKPYVLDDCVAFHHAVLKLADSSDRIERYSCAFYRLSLINGLRRNSLEAVAEKVIQGEAAYSCEGYLRLACGRIYSFDHQDGDLFAYIGSQDDEPKWGEIETSLNRVAKSSCRRTKLLSSHLAALPSYLVSLGVPPLVAFSGSDRLRGIESSEFYGFNDIDESEGNPVSQHAIGEDCIRQSSMTVERSAERTMINAKACVALVRSYLKQCLKQTSGVLSREDYANIETCLGDAIVKIESNGIGVTLQSILLRWIRSFLIEEKTINLETSIKYLSSLMKLLECDLDELPVDDIDFDYFEEMVAEYEVFSEEPLAHANKVHLNIFLRFCVERDYLPSVDRVFTCDEIFNPRTNLVSNGSVLELIETNLQEGTDQSVLVALVIVLAAFGGLRHQEIYDLRVGDFIFDDSAVYVSITDSKTDAGKRRIALSASCPSAALDIIVQHYRYRVEGDEWNLAIRSKRFLDYQELGVSRSVLAHTVNRALKNAYGERFCTHSLRHLYVTTCYLRWAEYRLGMRDKMTHSYIKCFRNDPAEKEFKAILDRGCGKTVLPTDFDLISQQIGHVSPQVSVRHYLHAMPTIMRAAYDKYVVTRVSESC